MDPFGNNLSNVFDNIAPKSKEDIQRRKERHRMRDAGDPMASQVYGSRNP